MKADRRRRFKRFGAIGRRMLAGVVLVSGACWAADPETPPVAASPPRQVPPEPQVGPAGGTIGRALSDGLGGSAAMRSDAARPGGAIANIEGPAPPAAKAAVKADAKAGAKATDSRKPSDPSLRSDPK